LSRVRKLIFDSILIEANKPAARSKPHFAAALARRVSVAGTLQM
jgi:hypothetical protein